MCQLVYEVMLRSPKTHIEPTKFPKNNHCAGSVCHRPDPRIQHDTEKLKANTGERTDDKARPIDVVR